MGRGYLKMQVSTADGALPVAGASVTVCLGEQVLYELITDLDGETPVVALDAPDAYHTFDPSDPGPWYASYDVGVVAPGYRPVDLRGVHVFDGDTSILPVHLTPQENASPAAARGLPAQPDPALIVFPDMDLNSAARLTEESIPSAAQSAIASRVLSEVVIPDTITVHLGAPSSSASNVRVSFRDYVKSTASNEIYSTWPIATLEANVLAIISFALNRVFTEWYPSRGYAFNITNSTSYDQRYVHGSAVSQNISNVVDRLFNTYVRRAGTREPYFTQFCNGTTVTCDGLSQWGSYYLGAQGYGTVSILRSYYPDDIELVTTNNIAGIPTSYPGYALQLGSTGEAVRTLQNYLNRIRTNYPGIPAIQNPNGVFGSDTQASVRAFQAAFNMTQDGIVGQATWYRIVQIYVSVTRLADLQSEGIRIGIGQTPPSAVLRQGATGRDVVELQFLLNFAAAFYDSLSPVLQTSRFDDQTYQAVLVFQRTFGLGADGVVGPATWNRLYEIYRSAENSTDIPSDENPAYPGALLRRDSRGESVRLMQRYLNEIATAYPSIPKLSADGIFGPVTQGAVTEFQRLFGLGQDGIIGPLTWAAIVRERNRVVNAGTSRPAYPGTLLRVGSRSEDVRLMQRYLNAIAARYPEIRTLSEDGIFGENTRAAVVAFQTRFGLSADGVIGPLTWERIVGEYNAL